MLQIEKTMPTDEIIRLLEKRRMAPCSYCESDKCVPLPVDCLDDDFVINRAIEALREKQERENPQPLTIDELKQMDGQPVWVNHIGYGVVDTHRHSKTNIAVVTVDDWYVATDVMDYGIYRYKPKEG